VRFGGRRRLPDAPALADDELRILLVQDPERAWRAFIDQYTPMLVALIERAGIRDRDEAMEVYVMVCERLAADDCGRLRRHDPARGALAPWLAVLVKHVLVDWVRSRAGRRRLFKSVAALPSLEQRVFELFYWEQRTPAEMVGLLGEAFGNPPLDTVIAALDRVQAALTDRQRGELLATAARGAAPVSLDAEPADGEPPLEVPDTAVDPERQVQTREADRLFERALASLPAEDAAIVRLKFAEGLSLRQIRDALHLEMLTEQRLRAILDALKQRLAADRFGRGDASATGLAFLEGGG
jgi:RNA polymerase sigma factor (sigma-70 family)